MKGNCPIIERLVPRVADEPETVCSLTGLLKNALCYVILSEAKDLLYSFSVRYSRCFAALSMTGVFFNNLLI